VTPNGKYAYTANAGTSTLSSYRIARNGATRLASSAAASTGANAGVIDIAVAPDGRMLYALAPRSLQIVAFRVGYDGSLASLGAAAGLPAGRAGLAAN
jgi:6-phosphogluconolactonase (cycloisomerase 2 family)